MKKFSLLIGNFDGVHLGHQALIKAGGDFSPEVKVMTFRPHPLRVLKPALAPVLLYDFTQQELVLRQHGVSSLEVINFNLELAQLEGRDFFRTRILPLNPHARVVGKNFKFGRGRTSSILDLEAWCKEAHIYFHAVEPVSAWGNVVSSSHIRECLAISDLQSVHEQLGREYEIVGEVIEGKKLGRTIGVPTANLKLATERLGVVPLRKGVYCVSNGTRVGVANIGVNPTTDAVTEGAGIVSTKFEVHFLNLKSTEENLYGQTLAIKFLKFLRDERKFSGIDELKSQIGRDIEAAKGYFQI